MFSFLNAIPEAYAEISGNERYPDLEGDVYFFGVHGGTVVVADIRNMPRGNNFHGFHIHAGNSCAAPGTHYAKGNETHPNHAGDMPPLLASDGMAFLAFYTNRFFPEDVIGRTVVIHEKRDDFMSQPSGNPGEIIACGKIESEDR